MSRGPPNRRSSSSPDSFPQHLHPPAGRAHTRSAPAARVAMVNWLPTGSWLGTQEACPWWPARTSPWQPGRRPSGAGALPWPLLQVPGLGLPSFWLDFHVPTLGSRVQEGLPPFRKLWAWPAWLRMVGRSQGGDWGPFLFHPTSRASLTIHIPHQSGTLIIVNEFTSFHPQVHGLH